MHDAWQVTRANANNMDGRYAGVARPSNVIEVKTESSQGSHSAPFPRALVEFFVNAFTDADDIVFDPFLGSGTTLAAAHTLHRIGFGCEISPAYCDVIVRRLMSLSGEMAILATTGEISPRPQSRAASHSTPPTPPQLPPSQAA